MNYDTPISEFLRTILDRKWHSLYELHIRFHLSAIEIYKTAVVLQKIGIIEWQGTSIRLQEDLDEQKLSIMNRLSKTSRPPQLEKFTPNY